MAETFKIDNDQFKKLEGWAKESTLASLLAATQASNSLLKAIGGKRTNNLDIAAQVQRGVVNPLREGTEDTVKGMRSYKASLKSLEDTQYKYSNATKNLISKFETAGKDPSKLIPEMLESSTGKVAAGLGSFAAMFGKKGQKAGVAITALGTLLGAAGAKAAERFLGAAEAFRPMIQSGITFGGSIDQMVSSVRGAGVSFDAAGRIVEQQGSALVAVGEKNFFAATDRMGATFKRLALTGDQGAEIQAELTDQMRTTGSLFNMTQEQYTGALENSLRMMQQQNILTGKSIKQQLAERKALAERASFQALIAGQKPEEQERLTNIFKTLATRMSTEQAMGIMLQSQGVGGTKGFGQAQLAMGGTAQEIAGQIGAGVDLQNLEPLLNEAGSKIEKFGQEWGRTISISLEKGISNPLTEAFTGTLPGLRTFQTAMAALADPEKAEQARKAQEGVDILGKKTQFMYDTLFDISKKIAKVEASAFEIVSEGIDKVLNSIIKAADKLNNSTISETKDSLSELLGSDTGILGIVGAAATTIGAGAAALLKGGTAATGAGAGGAVGWASKLAKGGGIGTAATLGAEGLEWLAPEFAGTRMGGAATGALKGAGYGALFGSIVPGLGTGIGAAAGGAIGGVLGSFYGGTPTAQDLKQQEIQAAAAAQVARGVPLTAPTLPAQGALSQEQATALEAYTTGVLIPKYTELMQRGLDQRNEELRKVLEEINSNTERVHRAIGTLDR
jgi:hypothetical protein